MLYFAYGSNTDLVVLREYLRSHGLARPRIANSCRAILPDWRIRTNYRSSADWGAANIEPCLNETVEGVLMEINPAVHQLLRRKEGWPYRYVETSVVIRVPSRRHWVVAMTFCVHSRCRLPDDVPVHPRYRETILRGAAHFRFSQHYQRALRAILQTA